MSESDWGTRLKNNLTSNVKNNKGNNKPEFGSMPVNEGANLINSDYFNYEIPEKEQQIDKEK